MSESTSVRASRDGDQFHYLWAARQCLRLLSFDSDLVAITIEAASPTERLTAAEQQIPTEVIDVAEYYGSQQLAKATRIRYVQLKHSTIRSNQHWTPSELKSTLGAFAKEYRKVKHLDGVDAASRLECCFISNRPVRVDFRESISDAAEHAGPRHPQNLTKLERFTGLKGSELSEFCSVIRFDDNQDGFWEQRNLLGQDIRCYLPDADGDAPVQLKDLVARKATSEGMRNPAICRTDVLRALNTEERYLFPAMCQIEHVPMAVSREQEAEIIQKIISAGDKPIIIHAAGGVGKSVFATRIQERLPEGSVSILYDCFGNGEYRSASGYRHRHQDALVQIANELAAKGLCHPLIATPHASQTDYAKAFIYRLKQSATSIAARNREALLCLVVDAADNAQMAAVEAGETRAFVLDLLRENIPDAVRAVFTCRTHRQHLLNPPPTALNVELQAFSFLETASHLRNTFPSATDHDVREFHSLTSQNPRVQSMALARDYPLPDILLGLGPDPTTVDDTLRRLLEAAYDRVRDEVGVAEKGQLDAVCTGLAVLRPVVPLPTLVALSGVDAPTVRSFVLDLGQAVILRGESIQFRDEPSETWFREKFRPLATEFPIFVERLKPLAASSAYVASVLPQLMLESGRLADLVTLALSSEALPSSNPIERRDVDLQRLQFALKASLRMNQHVDAAKLALKAGGESAGNGRQEKLLQDNTDLAATFLDEDRIRDISARGVFRSAWFGSHNVYESSLMSAKPALAGEARSRLRMAEDWLHSWSSSSEEERKTEHVPVNDIAEMALAHFNLHGSDSCARFLSRWKPRSISYSAGKLLSRRLVDHGRYNDLEVLGKTSDINLRLALAIVVELRRVHKFPSPELVTPVLKLIRARRLNLNRTEAWIDNWDTIEAVTAIVQAACKLRLAKDDSLAELLAQHLPKSPPHGLSSRHFAGRRSLLSAYALQAALLGRRLDILDLAHDELKPQLSGVRSRSYSSNETLEIREFQSFVGTLLPWHQLWAETVVGQVSKTNFQAAGESARLASSKAFDSGLRTESETSDEIAIVRLDALLQAGTNSEFFQETFVGWIDSLGRPLFTPTLTHLARVCARSESLSSEAFAFARRVCDILRVEREDAESVAQSYVALTRAILTLSPEDARFYFDAAVTVTSKFGDEVPDRSLAILHLAGSAGSGPTHFPRLAYELARSAELSHRYMNDKHFFWEETVNALVKLCPSSAVAILSRWRDRNFGWPRRLLPQLVNALLDAHCVNAQTALALTGFQAQWNEVDLLKATLPRLVEQEEKEIALALVYRYMRLEGQPAVRWRELNELALLNGVSISGIEDLIVTVEPADGERPPAKLFKDTQDNVTDWDSVFESSNLADVVAVSQTYRRYLERGRPYDKRSFWAETIRRVQLGHESEFVKALADVPELTVCDLRDILPAIPSAWTSRPSVRLAFEKTLKGFCSRFCGNISKDRYEEQFPFKVARDLSGSDESEFVQVILSELGHRSDLFDTRRLFSIVGLLATRMSSDESAEALSFGLRLYESVLDDTDGDGAWSASLEPPPDIDNAIAGYIWASLASPNAATRWEAAHVVRGCCMLRCEAVLSRLIVIAQQGVGGPFADSGLEFYALHGRQWLLIALACAAKEYPSVVVTHANFLIEAAINGERHVLIRDFAAKAVLALADSGVLETESELRLRLDAVNRPLHPPISRQEASNAVAADLKSNEMELDNDRYYFGTDMGPYWMEPLGDCFGLSQIAVLRIARRIVTKDWKIAGVSGWDNDQRACRGLYRDRARTHSHGSYPKTDDRSFYFGYHAMMVAAGELLATKPPIRDRNYPEYEFGNWLARHSLSRTDGKWLADRRDSVPLERLVRTDEHEENWPWSIKRNDFDAILAPAEGWINVWGDWTVSTGSRKEKISVASALVMPERSEALLRGIRVSHPALYRIPNVGADSEIKSGSFFLQGWIVEKRNDNRLDKFDPWGADIAFPPLTPAPFVLAALNLEFDPEQRVWKRTINGSDYVVLLSETWSQKIGFDDDLDFEKGTRLQASVPAVLDLLKVERKDLLVCVEIDRDFRHSEYPGNRKHGFDYILPSTRFFLIKADGSSITI